MQELVAASPIPEPYNSEEPPVELAQMLCVYLLLPYHFDCILMLYSVWRSSFLTAIKLASKSMLDDYGSR